MTRAMRQRLATGLQWKTDRKPLPSFTDWLIGSIAVLVFLLIMSLLDTGKANAESAAYQEQAIKAEVALVTLLNGDPVILDKDSGMVALAKVEVVGGPK